jgi:hypothetical protein
MPRKINKKKSKPGMTATPVIPALGRLKQEDF